MCSPYQISTRHEVVPPDLRNIHEISNEMAHSSVCSVFDRVSQIETRLLSALSWRCSFRHSTGTRELAIRQRHRPNQVVSGGFRGGFWSALSVASL